MVIVALLVACTPASPTPSPAESPPVSSDPVSPSPSPTPSPTEEPSLAPDPTPTRSDDRSELLVQPPEMAHADEAGAIAAAKYYVGLFEYVHLTGDLEMWEEMAMPDCEFCNAVSEGVREMHATGQYRVSGPPEWLSDPETTPVTSRTMWEVSLDVRVSASTTFDAEGNVVDANDSGVTTLRLGMLHERGAWRTVGILVGTDE